MTGDPRRDNKPDSHHWGGPDVPMEDEYAQHARERRERKQRERMDAAHEKAKAGTLRAEFLRLLTEDGPTDDRRRKDYNRAIFMPEGHAVWSATTLDMVMDKFDRAAKEVRP